MRTEVDLTLQDNASASARNIAQGLNTVAQGADNINSALDPTILDNYEKKLTDIAEKYNVLNRSKESALAQQEQQFKKITSAFSSAGNVVTSAGRGDVAGAGLKGLSSLTGFLGGTGGLLAGLGITAGVVGNQLAEQYGQRAQPASRIATLQGRMTTDMESNNEALNRAMQETVDSVAKYGKTFEEGARAQEAFLQAGGVDFGASRAGAYSMAYGVDLSRLGAFTGQAQRYGQEGSLNTVRALLGTQGLGSAQFDEVLGGMQDIFNNFLSRGVVRSYEDIARSQAFLSQAGITFQGGLGARQLQNINQVVTGAGALENQDDMFLYRTASRLTDGNLLETRKMLEQGFTPEIFKGLMREFEDFGFGRTESIVKLSKMFGISTSSAEQLYGLKDKDLTSEELEKRMRGDLAEGTGRTAVTEYVRNVENIKKAIIGNMGESAFKTRATIVSTGDKIVEAIDNWGDTTTITTKEAEAKKAVLGDPLAGDYRVPTGADTKKLAENFLLEMTATTTVPGVKSILDKVRVAQKSGATFGEIYGAIGEEYQQAREKGSAGMDSRYEGRDISPVEASTIERLLSDLIEETKKNTEAVREPAIYQPGVGLVR